MVKYSTLKISHWSKSFMTGADSVEIWLTFVGIESSRGIVWYPSAIAITSNFSLTSIQLYCWKCVQLLRRIRKDPSFFWMEIASIIRYYGFDARFSLAAKAKCYLHPKREKLKGITNGFIEEFPKRGPLSEVSTSVRFSALLATCPHPRLGFHFGLISILSILVV